MTTLSVSIVGAEHRASHMLGKQSKVELLFRPEDVQASVFLKGLPAP